MFDLPDRLAAKAKPALIAQDERHFADIAQALEQSVADLSERLREARKAPAGGGQRALDRDQEVQRLTGRLRTLNRFGVDLCLGRMVGADGVEPSYVGRLGLTDPAGRRLLVDWRSPAAGPFFAATLANPMGLASRRRYRWTRGRVSDYWDEVLAADGRVGDVAPDDESAFIAGLGSSRSPRMRDVLSTIAADQDGIIRAGSPGTLVVDGGPGTGKTVVALHRAAYLLYSDPRLRHRGGDVLFVGPSRPYLDYVADVLPSLGEDGVQTCILRDLVPEGATAGPEPDPEVARLKASVAVRQAIDAAVRFYEDPPERGTTIETPWVDVRISTAEWAEAFAAPEAGTPHNDAHDAILDELVRIVFDKLSGDADSARDVDSDGEEDADLSPDLLRTSLRRSADLRATLNRAWPLLDPADVVGDLWTVPAYLRRCAPELTVDEIRTLQRAQAQAWTVADLPWLDAARQRLGDPDAARRRRHQESLLTARREQLAAVIGDLVETDIHGEGVMAMLRHQDLQEMLADDLADTGPDPDQLAGPFLHVVVDEAQELTDAEWQMLLTRCPSRSFTVVGDRAQARRGFTEPWRERLERVGLERVTLAALTVNYRTPQEVMAEAAPVIRAALPDANVPTSIRSSGVPVVHAPVSQLHPILDSWLAGARDGIACVIGDPAFAAAFEDGSRVRSLTPELSKGLEFDLVVVVDPDAFGDGIQGAVDRYVAMTRATQHLVVLES